MIPRYLPRYLHGVWSLESASVSGELWEYLYTFQFCLLLIINISLYLSR